MGNLYIYIYYVCIHVYMGNIYLYIYVYMGDIWVCSKFHCSPQYMGSLLVKPPSVRAFWMTLLWKL